MQLLERGGKRAARHILAALDRVIAVHQHFRLHDRHDTRFLAQRRVARERMRVRIDAELRRKARADVDDGAPLRKARAELVVLGEPLAQTVEALGDRLVREAGERLRAGVDLDARYHADLRQILRKRRAVLGLLADRLVVHDHAADVVGRTRRREQHLAVGAPRLFGRLQLDGVEALLDRAAGLVRRQDALALRDHRPRDRFQFTAIHDLLPPNYWERARGVREAHGRNRAARLGARRIAKSFPYGRSSLLLPHDTGDGRHKTRAAAISFRLY